MRISNLYFPVVPTQPCFWLTQRRRWCLRAEVPARGSNEAWADAARATDAALERRLGPASKMPSFSFEAMHVPVYAPSLPQAFHIEAAAVGSKAYEAWAALTEKVCSAQAASDYLSLGDDLHDDGWFLIDFSNVQRRLDADTKSAWNPMPGCLSGWPNTLNLWNFEAHRTHPQERLGVTFHLDDGRSDRLSVVLQLVCERKYFLFSPEQFKKAAAFAKTRGIALPIPEDLQTLFPETTSGATDDFRLTPRWYEESYELMRQHGVGPTYEVNLKPGEFCVFDKSWIHGTLDYAEPYAALLTFFEVWQHSSAPS